MKLNTKNIMKSSWNSQNMNINWKSKDGNSSGMRPNHPLRSKHSRHTMARQMKSKWRKELKKQFNEEVGEAYELLNATI